MHIMKCYILVRLVFLLCFVVKMLDVVKMLAIMKLEFISGDTLFSMKSKASYSPMNKWVRRELDLYRVLGRGEGVRKWMEPLGKRVGLPDLVNKNTAHSVKSELQIKTTIFSVYVPNIAWYFIRQPLKRDTKSCIKNSKAALKSEIWNGSTSMWWASDGNLSMPGSKGGTLDLQQKGSWANSFLRMQFLGGSHESNGKRHV